MILMKYLITLIQKLMTKKVPIPMGRWNTDYCSVKMKQKVDLSNEDHCGPCGQYALTKLEPKKNNK